MKLETKDVVVNLSKKDIVKKVSVQVKDKQFVGLIGPNGSGKTTLLKSIYRVLKPAAGEILIDDTDIKEISVKETAKRMGVVSQFNNIAFQRITHSPFLNQHERIEIHTYLTFLNFLQNRRIKPGHQHARAGGIVLLHHAGHFC